MKRQLIFPFQPGENRQMIGNEIVVFHPVVHMTIAEHMEVSCKNMVNAFGEDSSLIETIEGARRAVKSFLGNSQAIIHIGCEK